MSRKLIVLSIAGILLALPAWGKKGEPKFKSVEVKRFARAEGVELSPDFPDLLYAELRKELQKSGLFEQILGENEVVDPSDAERSLILEGNLLEFGKGSLAKAVIIGYGAGRRSLRARVTLRRRSNNENLLDTEMKVRAPIQRDPKLLANALAREITREAKRQLGH